jgi:8-oxo-dGTP pyrophosphatase MutT (NUDIX family)
MEGRLFLLTNAWEICFTQAVLSPPFMRRGNEMGLPNFKPDVYHDQQGKEWVKPADVQPIWRPSAYAVIRRNGQILMVKTNGSGDVWEFPGGGIALGESIADAVSREVLEETGYQVHLPAEPTPMYLGQDQFYHIKRKTYYCGILMVYEVEYAALKPDLPEGMTVPPGQDEILEVGWIKLNELDPRNTNVIHFPAVRVLQRRSPSL